MRLGRISESLPPHEKSLRKLVLAFDRIGAPIDRELVHILAVVIAVWPEAVPEPPAPSGVEEEGDLSLPAPSAPSGSTAPSEQPEEIFLQERPEGPWPHPRRVRRPRSSGAASAAPRAEAR